MKQHLDNANELDDVPAQAVIVRSWVRHRFPGRRQLVLNFVSVHVLAVTSQE
jgi:hypothetical protein